MPCDKVIKPTDPWIFTLFDVEGNTFDARLHHEVLFVDSANFGLQANECVIPIFKNTDILGNQWILGTIFL